MDEMSMCDFGCFEAKNLHEERAKTQINTELMTSSHYLASFGRIDHFY
jgi:hypothetical protein